ncbi:MAG: N-acetylglucosamine-6-phosphate deacetylase [Clostridia bacterium]|nr:N-acetylglucosamine-6-phosphate deacetylase [Clostridia bacterium]
MTQIKNGMVCNPDCTGFEKRDLFFRDGVIVEAEHDRIPDRVIDAEGSYVIPGLIDIHTHGVVGVDYAAPDDFSGALLFEAGQGVTTVIPTVSTRAEQGMLADIRHIADQCRRGLPGACIGGIHLEGPFISAEKRGAMPISGLECTLARWRRLYEAGEGLIRLMTIAPELVNALDVIRDGVKKGVRMSLGHTGATYGEAMAGIEAGATGATHTFNAMRPYGHRDPGVLGAVLTDARVDCEVICDMIHLSPVTVELIRRAKGVDGMILISDSGYGTGLAEGEYQNNHGQTEVVKDGVIRLPSGVIFGSGYTAADGARKLMGIGFTLAEIARVGALNPARAVGLDPDRGSIRTGKRADLILCDGSMNLKRVFVYGKEMPLSPQAFRL